MDGKSRLRLQVSRARIVLVGAYAPPSVAQRREHVGEMIEFVDAERSQPSVIPNIIVLGSCHERVIFTGNALVREVEKKSAGRATYYKHYTGKDIHSLSNYHICLDVGEIGVEKCREIILDLVTKPE